MRPAPPTGEGKWTPQAWRAEAQEVIARVRAKVEARSAVSADRDRFAGCHRSTSCCGRSTADRRGPAPAPSDGAEVARRRRRACSRHPADRWPRARPWPRAWSGGPAARPRLARPVINATGVVLHTNLGRALLSPLALERLALSPPRYSNLELDVRTKERGSRYDHVDGLLRRLTGAEAALVVNNNAAAVLLALESLARGREVIVSRGELIEIGGDFRIPDIMAAVRGPAREVGTTNRTRLRDYARRSRRTRRSSSRCIPRTTGWWDSRRASPAELAELGRARGLPVLEDLGSGSLPGPAPLGLSARADRAGDGRGRRRRGHVLGRQAPRRAAGRHRRGRRPLVERLRQNPLNRALRIDKLTLAALEATLRATRIRRPRCERSRPSAC